MDTEKLGSNTKTRNMTVAAIGFNGKRRKNGLKQYSWNLFLLHRFLYLKTHYFLLSTFD